MVSGLRSKSLPEKYRTILHWRFVEGLSISEIAAKTHQSKNTVAVQIHRGLAKLQLLYRADARVRKVK